MVSTRKPARSPAISAAQPMMRPGGYHSSAPTTWPLGVAAGRDRSARWVRSAVGAAIDSAKTAAVAGPRLAAMTTVPGRADNSAPLPPPPRPARQNGGDARENRGAAREAAAEREANQ